MNFIEVVDLSFMTYFAFVLLLIVFIIFIFCYIKNKQ